MIVKYSTEPKLWRIRGKAPDGLIVTLGRYDTEAQAEADLQRFVTEQVYRDVAVEAISPRPPGPESPK
jgi:hypothetical protein